MRKTGFANGFILQNVPVEELIIKASFDELKHHKKRAFIRSKPGFLDSVLARLQTAGIQTTKATICRTWNGKVDVKRRNLDIVAALDAEYLDRISRRARRVA